MWSNARTSRRIAVLAVAALASGAGRLALAQDAAKYRLKPGASGTGCLGCHADFKDVLALPSVHTPVKSGQCSGCHDPHAARHGSLLEASTDAICGTCHGSMVPEGAVSSHEAVVQGKCVSCHDPHASPNKAVLLRAGNELCLDCHKDLKTELASAAHRHAPVDRNCLGCHDPHASKTAPALLTKTAPALCLSCHKPDQPGFAKAHSNYPVAKSDCSSCHNPHGSSQAGILWASVHAPVQNRMCAQCHTSPADTGASGLRAKGSDLCRGCHNEMFIDLAAKNRVHAPVLDGVACAHCHEPHAGKADGLLSAPQKELCGSCHQDSVARQERAVSKHPPVAEGACSTCHLPHAADDTFLFPAGGSQIVCGACHDWATHTAHPLGEKAVDQRNPNLRVDCESCHRSHGTSFKHSAHGDVKGELCTQCHTQFTR
jgi:predicted CXXCH cytochrome family protein